MFKFRMAVVMLLALAWFGCGGGSSSPNQQPSNPTPPPPQPGPPLPPGVAFFALDIGNFGTPWPTQLGLKFGIWRTLGAQLRWSQLEPCQPADETDVTDPCYSWNTSPVLDQWMNAATTNGQKILYTAYYTPSWASSNPTDACQNGSAPGVGLGGCDPPDDVATGDNHWKNFLIALYTHVTNNKEHVDYWECWNEPNVPNEYNGALSDLNTMCQDLRSTIRAVDTTALFTTPAPASGGAAVNSWLSTWIGDGYADSADIIAFHGYVGNNINNAEDVLTTLVSPLKTTVAAASSVSSKPLWDTEGSDDIKGVPISDPDLHAAFYARFSLVQQSAGVAAFSYWGYDFGDGISLVNNPGSSAATLNTAGIAWQQIYKWTVSDGTAQYASACAPVPSGGTVWQCSLTVAGASNLIVWDTSQTSTPCPNSACGITSFTVPSGFTQFDDLAGDVNQPISGGTVMIGAKPIRLH